MATNRPALPDVKAAIAGGPTGVVNEITRTASKSLRSINNMLPTPGTLSLPALPMGIKAIESRLPIGAPSVLGALSKIRGGGVANLPGAKVLEIGGTSINDVSEPDEGDVERQAAAIARKYVIG